MTYDQLKQTIIDRRSIPTAQFSPEPIKEEDLRKLLALAHEAPNHKKTEPWRFYVIQGDARQRLSDFFGAYYDANTPLDKQSEIRRKQLVEKPLQAGAVIALCVKYSGEDVIPQWEELAATGCAIQNMWLGCKTLGLGGFWSSPGNIKDAGKFLGFGEDTQCLGWFYVGYTSFAPAPAQRGNLEEKVTWISE